MHSPLNFPNTSCATAVHFKKLYKQTVVAKEKISSVVKMPLSLFKDLLLFLFKDLLVLWVLAPIRFEESRMCQEPNPLTFVMTGAQNPARRQFPSRRLPRLHFQHRKVTA